MREWFENLQLREQRMVAAGAAVVLIMLLWLIIGPFYGSLNRTQKVVAARSDDLAVMRQIASRAKITPDQPPESIVLVVQNSARQHQIAIANFQPSGNNSINARLDDVSFNSLVSWLAQLETQHGVHVQTASIRKGQAPGTVDSTLLLTKN